LEARAAVEAKPAEWEDEKGREGAVEENGFLCAAVVGLGFCWKADVTATERLRLERRGVRKGRRKVEENSLKVEARRDERGLGGGRDTGCIYVEAVESLEAIVWRRNRREA
jgi:hypothetical protein